MYTYEVAIEGMSCSHCVTHVKEVLEKIEDSSLVDIKIGKAILKSEAKDVENDIKKAIEEDASYKIKKIKTKIIL